MKNHFLNDHLTSRLNFSYYSNRLNHDWLIGLIEAEGGFYGKGRHIIFSISQHLSDWYLLSAIKHFLGVGKLVPHKRKDGRLGVEYVVNNRTEIKEVIVLLVLNQIRTKKKLNQFNIWINEHFDLPPSERNSVLTKQWITGFVDGDGSFFLKVSKSSKHKCGFNVRAVFDVTQVSGEKEILINIGKTIGCPYTLSEGSEITHLVITTLTDLISHVEPFFNESSAHLLTRKYLDFIIWKEALRIMEQKRHLTLEGVTLIKELRDLQRYYRQFIHPSIINEVNKIKPQLFSSFYKDNPS